MVIAGGQAAGRRHPQISEGILGMPCACGNGQEERRPNTIDLTNRITIEIQNGKPTGQSEEETVCPPPLVRRAQFLGGLSG